MDCLNITDPEFTVPVMTKWQDYVAIRPEDEHLLDDESDPTMFVRALECQYRTLKAENPDAVRPIFGNPVECIKATKGEFEFLTLWKGLDTKNESDDGWLSWGRSQNGEMWFTPDSRCVNREYLDGIHERIAQQQCPKYNDPWMNEVLDASRVTYKLKLVGVEPGTVVRFDALSRTHYFPESGCNHPKASGTL